MSIQDAALAFHDAGACVLPAADDGSKRPALAWDRYKQERPTREQVAEWTTSNAGIGIVCGAVSGNVEMFEAEAAAVDDELVRQLTNMLPPALVAKLNTYVERSPKGGVHWIFRVDGMPVKGNTKLARRYERKPGQQTVTVLFETRGEGGWTVIAPSNGPTHPSGKAWQVVYGRAGIIPLLTAEEYRLLHACAATFDETPTPEQQLVRPALSERLGKQSGETPGQDFEGKVTWDEILLPAGWTKVRQRGDVVEWVRPGKSAREGISATTGWQGDWLYVFTTSTEFESERTYTKFGAYTLLHHHGNFSTAAGALRKAGYGAKQAPRANPLRVVQPDDSVTNGTQTMPTMPTAPTKKRRVVLTAAPTRIKPVQWWWQDRMPVGCLSLLAGREGIGKSALAYDFAAQLTRGTLLGQWYGVPKAVIICATEDSWAHTITPRLLAAKAEMTLVLRAAVQTDETENYFLVLPEDIEGLEEAVKERGDVAMMLLDPLISRLDAKLDTHKDAEVRQALEPLVEFADRTSLGVLGLIHANKSGGNDPLNVLMGSRAFGAVARSVSFAVIDRDDPGVRMVGTPKNNLGRDDLPSLRYSLEGVQVGETQEGPVFAPRVAWGEEDDRSVADVLADNNDHHGGDRGALEEAENWLTDYLIQNGGLQPSRDIKDRAKTAGHTEPTLKRAAKRLKIEMTSVGFPRVTYWSLPGSQSDPTPEQDPKHSGLARAGGLSHSDLTINDLTTNSRSEGLFPVGSEYQDQETQQGAVSPVGSPGELSPRARADWSDCALDDPEEDPSDD